MGDGSFEARLDQLESRFAIWELCSAYCKACDDRDMRSLRLLFTDDVELATQNGTMPRAWHRRSDGVL